MNTRKIAMGIAWMAIAAGIFVLGLLVRVLMHSDIGYWGWSGLLSLYLDMAAAFGLIGIGGIIFAVLPEKKLGASEQKKED